MDIIREFGISYEPFADDLFTVDSIESTSSLLYHAVHAGATLFNCYSVEDVIFKEDKVSGVVVNWTPVLREGLHVDPLNVLAKYVIDGTGHDSEISKVVARKNGIRLATPTGAVAGERSLDVVEGERAVVEGTKEIYPDSTSAVWHRRQCRAPRAWGLSSVACLCRARRSPTSSLTD